MSTKLRGLRPSPAMIVACLALFVAMGGVGYAAVKLKPNSVKTKTIKNGAVTTPKIADDAVSTAKLDANAIAPNAARAADADRLGGVTASNYQHTCSGGGIKATVVVHTGGLPGVLTNVPGFNCLEPGNLTSSVQVERLEVGVYAVRFVGNSGSEASGSAIATEEGDDGDGSVSYEPFQLSDTGEIEFVVFVHDAAGNLVDNRTFSLLAF
jgi:hypothetical protein